LIVWDTSALTACYQALEKGHSRALSFLKQRDQHAASSFILLEGSSAFARVHRHDSARSRAAIAWLEEQLIRFDLVAIDNTVLSRAKKLAQRHGLRGADALHVATALELALIVGRRRLHFITFDAEQARAAHAEKLRVIDPGA